MRLLGGVAECVIRRNTLVSVDVQGYQDVERRVPMTARSLQRCYSMTKSLTSVGLLALWEDRKLGLDDPVAKYIPEFAHMKVRTADGKLVNARRLITLRQLMAHTSGLGYGQGRDDRTKPLKHSGNPVTEQYRRFVLRVDAGKIANLEEWCRELAKQPLNFQPGERWEYSWGMDVLGRVLEVASGMPLDRFIKARVLGPIGMKDTEFFITPTKAQKQLAALYSVRKVSIARRKFRLSRVDGARPEHSGWVAGRNARILAGGGFVGSCDGGVVSSLRDYALFCSTLMNAGFSVATKRQVLKPATVRHGCSNLLKQRSVTPHVRFLKGWSDCERDADKGWAPLGITDGNWIFMGGIGCWSINLRSKTATVTLPNSTWGNFDSIPGWEPEVDEIDEAVKKAEKDFRRKAARCATGRKNARTAPMKRVKARTPPKKRALRGEGSRATRVAKRRKVA